MTTRIRISLLSAQEEQQVKKGELQEVVGDTVYYLEVKPFDELTVEEHIRMFESNAVETGRTSEEVKVNRIVRITGVPMRFVRHMRPNEAEHLLELIEQIQRENDRTLGALAKVHETLNNWAEEHAGAAWTAEDARSVIADHGLYRERIEVNGRVYTAHDLEEEPYGKWIDLQGLMHSIGENKRPESEAYVQALSIMMRGADGPFPVQGAHQADEDYQGAVDAYMAQRRRDFMDARFIDVLGCAAFFFSSSKRFALLCGRSMSLLQKLMRPGQEPEGRIIPPAGVFAPS